MKKIIKDKTTYMILYRQFNMDGGIWDYGTAKIIDFVDDFKKADKIAKETFKAIHKKAVDPFVWILECKKTYRDEGVVITTLPYKFIKNEKKMSKDKL